MNKNYQQLRIMHGSAFTRFLGTVYRHYVPLSEMTEISTYCVKETMWEKSVDTHEQIMPDISNPYSGM